MRTSLILLLAISIFGSCKPKDKPEESAALPENERAVLENPSSWVKLIERDGKQIIFQPCDANNTGIRINKDTLYINFGQEEEFYSIVRFDEAGTKTMVRVKMAGDENEQQFPVEVMDAEGRIARWQLNPNDSTTEVFVNTKFANDYSVVKQPCRECWGKDVCDEAEKADSTKNQ